MSMVLPHERKPMRYPVVPATFTALLETMTNTTIPVPDAMSRKAFLCRDPCYPVWVERAVKNASNFFQANTVSNNWTIAPAPDSTLDLPVWDWQVSFSNVGLVPNTPSIDGAAIALGRMTDYTPIALIREQPAIYIPPGSDFVFRVALGGPGSVGGYLVGEFGYIVNGEERHCTIEIPTSLDGFSIVYVAGTAIPAASGEGIVPYGFTWLRSLRVGPLAVNAQVTPAVYQLGWSSDGVFTAIGAAEKTLMLPVFPPAEFGNSTLPYSKTRLNASAALFTNVTAALNKEGTILAARLKPSSVDPWNFNSTHIDAVHPKLRYFGPLEKGLYTFTTPSGNVDNLDDRRFRMTSFGTINQTERPLFDPVNIGVFNAIIFSDLGSAANGTQLAASCYTHLEFETTSSLFPIGVSTMTLESLHAAEVALLGFGHFHENPLHWAAIASAAASVLRKVAPMVAPVVAHYGQKALDQGVQMLRGRSSGDRTMPQAGLQTARAKPPARKKAKAQKKKK